MQDFNYLNNRSRDKIEIGDLAYYDSLAGPVKVVIVGDTPWTHPLAPAGRVRVQVTSRTHYLYEYGRVIDTKPIWLSLRRKAAKV